MQDQDAISTCAWCGNHVAEGDGPYGLITRFRKKIRLGRHEEKRIAISVAHLDRKVFGFVRRRRGNESAAPLDLTFRTCSQGCAKVLHSTLQFERKLFSAPMLG